MSQVIGIVDVYNVSPVTPGRVRLEMILKAASFPDFAVDLDAEVAQRIGYALLAHAEYQIARRHLGDQAAGGSGAG